MTQLNRFFFLLILSNSVYAQDNLLIEGIYDDPSLQTQTAFVEEILYVAGYVPESIEIYQTLPNYAHVFRVKLDSVNGGFMFVRWDKEKKEHFIANKMIDPGFYYNLKAAREIMRKQTQNASFSVKDKAVQASDQVQISDTDLQEIREAYDLKEDEKRKIANEIKQKEIQKEQRKIERKASKKKNNR
tara:strand:- start:4441 stop:5001 length:561 start_codon:yes stop_codon:yes gene_type:complete